MKYVLLWFGVTDVAEALGEYATAAAARRDMRARRDNWQGRFQILPVRP